MLETELVYFTILSALLILIALIRSNNIIVITIINGVFSLFTGILYLVLDAPDVAMTEASISALVFIFAILAIKPIYKKSYLFQDDFKPLLFICCAFLAGALIYASNDLPEFGSPKFNHYYIQNSLSEIGITSVVASILASYRGYDTMLETLVILIGGIGVLLISEKSIYIKEKQDQLITIMTRIMLPITLLFALYVQMHGEISPGGGFQAGSIIATIFIAYALSYGKQTLLKFISLQKLKIIAISGVSLYLGIGLTGLVKGGEFLNYNVIFNQKIGIMLVEFGVVLTVSATMLLIYLGVSDASDQSI